MSEWQKIETAPKNKVVLVANNMVSFDAWYDESVQGWVDGEESLNGELVRFFPTHWMPLPSPPQDDK